MCRLDRIRAMSAAGLTALPLPLLTARDPQRKRPEWIAANRTGTDTNGFARERRSAWPTIRAIGRSGVAATLCSTAATIFRLATVPFTPAATAVVSIGKFSQVLAGCRRDRPWCAFSRRMSPVFKLSLLLCFPRIGPVVLFFPADRRALALDGGGRQHFETGNRTHPGEGSDQGTRR